MTDPVTEAPPLQHIVLMKFPTALSADEDATLAGDGRELAR